RRALWRSGANGGPPRARRLPRIGHSRLPGPAPGGDHAGSPEHLTTSAPRPTFQLMHMTRVGAALVCLAVACGPGGKDKVASPPLPKNAPAPTLPEIPAPAETKVVEPSSGHTPSARSPLFDALEAENERWMAVLKDQQLPAYYLAYQVVDRRGVVIEAEEGKLLSQDDEQERLLHVDLRVGRPDFDNRRPIRGEK